jgi:hypothetical protein
MGLLATYLVSSSIPRLGVSQEQILVSNQIRERGR